MSNVSNVNTYIENYLNNYLKIKNPEFAILLSGKWGSGKTYFIEKYIEKHKGNINIKFIKISLFGLKETDSIDEQIFNSLHSVLGNKYVKLTGNIIKNALKFGIKVDWDNDGKTDGTAKIDTKSFNPLDFFSDEKKSKKELVFIFDDLERTDIKLTEILGYINSLVEQSKFKVIILGSEEKIIKKDKGTYTEFKEKIIGKTFEVRHEFEEVLNLFINEGTDKAKVYLLEHLHVIQNIYKLANYNNLRHIKQILLEFEYFVNLIDDRYLKNKEFMGTLINNFFALSIEIKGGKITEKELSKNSGVIWDFLNDDKKEKSEIEKIYEKYTMQDTPMFNGKGWVSIIFKSSISREVLNKAIGDLSFFLVEKEKEQPSWVKLWHYRELDDDDFEKILNDVLEKFKDCLYGKHEHFLHVIALLIFFSKEKLCNLTTDEIKRQVEKCISEYKATSLWKDELFEGRLRFNGTGLSYMDGDSNEFRKLYQLIMDENKKIYKKTVEEKEKEKINRLLENINDTDYINNLLLEEYKFKPIFQNVSSKKFISSIKKSKNKDITELGYTLNERYPENHTYNGKKVYCHMIEELVFWEDVGTELLDYINKTEKLRKHILTQFNSYAVESIKEKLKSCDGNH